MDLLLIIIGSIIIVLMFVLIGGILTITKLLEGIKGKVDTSGENVGEITKNMTTFTTVIWNEIQMLRNDINKVIR